MITKLPGKNHRASKAVVVLSGVALMVTGGLLVAGPLDPPAGPVTSTYKTLTEVEPRISMSANNTPGDSNSVFKITRAGSYYLTANVEGVANKHGIEISASGVTLDLNGFDVLGVGDASTFDGISATGHSLTIRNGSVRNWGDEGVDVVSVAIAGALIEKIQVSDNGGTGIGAGGSSVVRGCTATNNGGTGISAGRLIEGCIAIDNVGTGLSTGQGGTILDSTSFSNDGDGIFTGFGCTVTNCTSDNNGGDGIVSSNGTTITNCSFIANSGSGINVFNSITIRNCTSVSNQQYGIDADTACAIESCVANSNVLGGIRCGSRATVRNNVAGGNASGTEIGAGILVTGNGTRVEGNTCNTNDFGIDVDGTSNIIIRNTCTGNTQAFVIATDNLYGPIIDRRIPTTVTTTSPVVGFAATGTMGSSDSNANFAH